MEIMKNILFLIISCFFLYFNYKIILSDIKEKIIPNKYLKNLLLLLPFYYISLFLFTPSFFIDINTVHIWIFVIQILLTLGIWFSLYYFWLWWAGDAKYLVVLWFYIPHLWIIAFIWNIALLVIFYLLLYFVWFYFWKIFINKQNTKKLCSGIYSDIKDRLIIYFQHTDGNIYKKNILLKTLRWILFFLIIFVSMRLIRIYFLNNIIENENYNIWITIIEKYNIYIILLVFSLFFLCLYIIRISLNKVKEYLISKYGIKNNNLISFSFILVLLVFLLSFIYYELLINPTEIKQYLVKIFTLYISLYLVFKIITYAYKITFQISEQYIINLKGIRTWDLVDKEFLIKMFWEQSALWYTIDSASQEEIDSRKKLILYPNPKEYFKNITNPIDEETKKFLFTIYEIVNEYHKKNTPWYVENNNIKVLKTFALGWYILLWFILTITLWNTIFKIIIVYFYTFIFPF